MPVQQHLQRWQKYGDPPVSTKKRFILEYIHEQFDLQTMIKMYNEWFESLAPLKKLIVSFVLNWLFWLIAWHIAEQFFFDEKRSWKYHVFHATWMTCFIIIPSKWTEVKQIFNRQHRNDQM